LTSAITPVIRKIFSLKLPNNENTPSQGELYRRFIAIAWPSTLEGALISIISSVDTMMVGRLGSAAIASVGLTSQPRLILLVLATALCVGTTALVARRKGANDREAANQAFAQSFMLATILGFIIMTVGYFGAPFLMDLAGANEDTRAFSITYFRVISLAFVFNCWSLCICAAMRAIGKTKITLVTNLSANLVNVCLNYCLIEGHFGFPALGVKGAAIATAIGTFVASMIALVFALRPNGYLKLSLAKMLHFDKTSLKALLSVGSSSAAESACLRVGFLINSKMVAGLGTSAFAAYQIVNQVAGLSFTLGDGLATAGATMVGQSLGAKRKDLARVQVTIARKLSMVTSLTLMLFLFCFHRQLGMLFTDEEDVIFAVSLSLYVLIAGVIPQNGRVVYSGCLRGAGDTRYVALCALLSVTILRPLLTYLFCYPLNSVFPHLLFQIIGPWLSFGLDALFRDLMLRRRISQGKWVNIKL